MCIDDVAKAMPLPLQIGQIPLPVARRMFVLNLLFALLVLRRGAGSMALGQCVERGDSAMLGHPGLLAGCCLLLAGLVVPFRLSDGSIESAKERFEVPPLFTADAVLGRRKKTDAVLVTVFDQQIESSRRFHLAGHQLPQAPGGVVQPHLGEVQQGLK